MYNKYNIKLQNIIFAKGYKIGTILPPADSINLA